MSESVTRDPLEPGSVDAPRVLLSAAGVLLFLCVAMGALAATYFTIVPKGAPRIHPLPQPRLQGQPTIHRERVLAEQRARLNGYRWATEDRSLISIPIDRAMAIIAQRGTDAYAPVTAIEPHAPGGKP